MCGLCRHITAGKWRALVTLTTFRQVTPSNSSKTKRRCSVFPKKRNRNGSCWRVSFRAFAIAVFVANLIFISCRWISRRKFSRDGTSLFLFPLLPAFSTHVPDLILDNIDDEMSYSSRKQATKISTADVYSAILHHAPGPLTHPISAGLAKAKPTIGAPYHSFPSTSTPSTIFFQVTLPFMSTAWNSVTRLESWYLLGLL